MEPIETTDAEVLATLHRIAGEHPDYVYEHPDGGMAAESDCFYVHGDRPGCLIGHVLHDLGVSLEVLQEYEHTSAYDVAADVLSGVKDPVLGQLDRAQRQQDEGASWGVAVQKAL